MKSTLKSALIVTRSDLLSHLLLQLCRRFLRRLLLVLQLEAFERPPQHTTMHRQRQTWGVTTSQRDNSTVYSCVTSRSHEGQQLRFTKHAVIMTRLKRRRAKWRSKSTRPHDGVDTCSSNRNSQYTLLPRERWQKLLARHPHQDVNSRRRAQKRNSWGQMAHLHTSRLWP